MEVDHRVPDGFVVVFPSFYCPSPSPSGYNLGEKLEKALALRDKYLTQGAGNGRLEKETGDRR